MIPLIPMSPPPLVGQYGQLVLLVMAVLLPFIFLWALPKDKANQPTAPNGSDWKAQRHDSAKKQKRL
jgi:hypothetical protein